MQNEGLPFALAPEEVERIRKNVNASSRANVLVAVCTTCGTFMLRSLDIEGQGETRAVLTDDHCDRCKEFRHLHPAVFAFVTQLRTASAIIQQRVAEAQNALVQQRIAEAQARAEAEAQAEAARANGAASDAPTPAEGT